jgi:hypothetical protein
MTTNLRPVLNGAVSASVAFLQAAAVMGFGQVVYKLTKGPFKFPGEDKCVFIKICNRFLEGILMDLKTPTSVSVQQLALRTIQYKGLELLIQRVVTGRWPAIPTFHMMKIGKTITYIAAIFSKSASIICFAQSGYKFAITYTSVPFLKYLTTIFPILNQSVPSNSESPEKLLKASVVHAGGCELISYWSTGAPSTLLGSACFSWLHSLKS